MAGQAQRLPAQARERREYVWMLTLVGLLRLLVPRAAGARRQV
jgi:hypothetical protein